MPVTLREQVLALREGDKVEVTWQHSRQGPLTYVGTIKTAIPDGASFVSRAYMPPRVLLESDPPHFYKGRNNPNGRVLAIKKLDKT